MYLVSFQLSKKPRNDILQPPTCLCLLANIHSTVTDEFSTLCPLSINGFSNNLSTYGMVSGLWTSTFALGSFIGPSGAGVMYDYVGFRASTLFVVAINFLLVGPLSATPFFVDNNLFSDQLRWFVSRCGYAGSGTDVPSCYATTASPKWSAIRPSLPTQNRRPRRPPEITAPTKLRRRPVAVCASP